MYESRYTDIIAHEYYLLDLELQQSDMTRYVNECVILSGTDKRKAIEEMAIFNEGALGDKFKKVWARIKSFFAKIYQKFLESLQAWAGDNIAYLKQYANIIFEKKCTLKTVKMQDHFNGQKNFDTMISHVKDVFAKVPDLTSLEAITDNLKNLAGSNPGDKLSEKGNNLVDGFTYVQQTGVLQAMGVNNNNIVDSSDLQGFAGRFRNWLNGGEEINEYSGSELEGKNMELMYNFLYKYDATVEKLKKIKDAFDTGMTSIETSFKKGYDSMSKSVKGVDQADVAKAASDAADQSKTDDSISGTLASELRNASKEAKATKEAYSYVYGRAINEADIDSGNSNSNTDTKTNTGDPSYNAKNNKSLDTENKATRKQGTETASDVKSNANQIKGNAGGKGQLTAAELKAKGVTDDNLSKYEDYALSMIRAWGNTRSLCMGAALNSLSDTRRDYFDVIRAHVRTWIGTTTAPDQNTDTKPTNTNATS